MILEHQFFSMNILKKIHNFLWYKENGGENADLEGMGFKSILYSIRLAIMFRRGFMTNRGNKVHGKQG